MVARLSFFPVGNGAMTLLCLESGRKILIDINIRVSSDEIPDVAEMLRERLGDRDSEGRLFVDAFLLSHPDQDHCRAISDHFHLGKPEDWSEKTDKIFIREIWSSPLVFRRASSNHTICPDAKLFNTEAKRRVQVFRDGAQNLKDGDRILILGEDEAGKTDDLTSILIKTDQTFTSVNGTSDATVTCRLLAPFAKSSDAAEETKRSKNHSSTILQFSITGEGTPDACRYLSGGDAEVAIWENLWAAHGATHADWLSYHILEIPHHSSWHTLSYDSLSEMGEEAKVCPEAVKALSQAFDGAVLISSSNPIKDDGNDPPSHRAKKEYQKIAEKAKGSFRCIGEKEGKPDKVNKDAVEFEIGKTGLRPRSQPLKTAAIIGAGAVGEQPLGHGQAEV